MPSTLSTVCVGSESVAAVSAWMMASVPALVDRANWCGKQLAWMFVAKICPRLLDTRRRSTSPMMMPRTLPFGFCRATTRPKPMLAAIVAGTLACASC